MPKTRSEILFEAFLLAHGVDFRPVPTVANVPAARRPDYAVSVGDSEVYCEVKESARRAEFAPRPPGEARVHSVEPGKHPRGLIKRSAGQARYGADAGIPSLLIVYNDMGPLQLRGTDFHDFEAAMYGDLMLSVGQVTGRINDAFFGKDKSFTEGMNTSFAAVGHLCDRGGTTLTLYENCFANPGLPYGDLPPCFDVVRTVLD